MPAEGGCWDKGMSGGGVEVQRRTVRSTEDIGRGSGCGGLSRLSTAEPCMRLIIGCGREEG